MRSKIKKTAMEDLFEFIEEKLATEERVNVIIAGTSCSGKTTLANKIKERFAEKYGVTLISQDSYFKDLRDIPKSNEGYLTDSILAFYASEFVYDVDRLLEDGVTTVPNYDISTNTRLYTRGIVRRSRLNVFEGLHTISLLNSIEYSIKIFLDIKNEVCLSRRIERDMANYNVSEEQVKSRWKNCIEPMNERYILPQKKYAHVIMRVEDQI